MSRCSKKCNEIKAKIDSISGLDDDIVHNWLKTLESFTNIVVEKIEKYADEDELNGTCFKRIEGVTNANKRLKILKNLFFNEDGSIVNYIDFTSSYGDEWNGYTLEQYVKAFIDLKDEINKEKVDSKEKKGDILRYGNLSLGYKTLIERETKSDDLEICLWDSDGKYKWTIASFDCKNENGYKYYELNTVRDYLDDKAIDWYNFGKLVQKGYEILKDLEENENER